jgi:DNA-binding IclR family transcriptional regulator
MAELVESVVKAARVLRAFEPHTGAMTVREISTRTGIPRSTCHALCATLVHVRILEALPEGGYRLGPAAAWLGAQVFERTGLVEAATPTMQSLVRIGGAHVELTQYVSKGWMVFLHHLEDPRMRAANRVGYRVPAYQSAEGRAVLACMEMLDVHDILQTKGPSDLGAPGVEDTDDLDAVLRSVALGRKRGYAVLDRARSSLRTVAAPLLDAEGAPVGALSVSLSRHALTEPRVEALAVSVRAACHEVSQRLTSRTR